jgi:hypothetical protein
MIDQTPRLQVVIRGYRKTEVKIRSAHRGPKSNLIPQTHHRKLEGTVIDSYAKYIYKGNAPLILLPLFHSRAGSLIPHVPPGRLCKSSLS